MLINKFNKKKFANYFILLLWFSCFFSININPVNFFYLSFIEKLRLFAPFFLFFLTFYISNNRLNIFDEIKKNILFLFIFILILSYLLFTYFNNFEDPYYNYNLFFPFVMLISLLALQIPKNNSKIFFYIFWLSIFILSFLFIFFLTKYFISNLHFYGSAGYYIKEGTVPRATGMARIALLIYTAFCVLLFYIISNKIKFLFYVVIPILGFFSLYFQSRLIIVIFLIINLLLFLFFYKEFIKKKITIFITFIFPLIFFIIAVISFNHFKNFKSDIVNSDIVNSDIVNTEKYTVVNIYTMVFRYSPEDSLKTGRYEIWKNYYYHFQKNKTVFGYGVQSDRIILKDSIHSGLLYGLISSGIFGLITYMTIVFYLGYFVLKKIIEHLKKKIIAGPEYFIAILYLVIFCTRSIFETSFMIFSIDYIFFILSIKIIKK